MSGGNSSNNSFNFNIPPPPAITSPFVAYGGGGFYPPPTPNFNFNIPPPPVTTSSPFVAYGGGGFYPPPPPPPFGGFGHFSVPPPPPTPTFDDDEPLPSLSPPPPIPPSSHPSATATVTTHPEYPAVAASSPSSFSVLVQVRAPPAPTNTRDRTPIDLVAVLDVSSSMSGEKLALVKRAVAFIIHTLGPDDRLSIVSFSDQSNRALHLSCMTDTGRLRASAAVNALCAMGCTNIKAGLDMGVRVLDQRRHRNPVAGILLLSDGQDTTGYRNYGNPGSKDYSYPFPTNTTVPIHTFGFGYDHDPRAMHTIADTTGGTFSFIDAEGDVQDAFAMCIGGLLSVSAQKVELMVNAASKVHIASVSSGSYSSKVFGHGLVAVIEFGDLYADEEKDILVHVTVPVSQVQPLMQLMSVKGSYKEPLTEQVVYVDGEAAAIRRPEVLSPEDGVVSLRVDRQRNRLLVGESIKEAQERAERQDFGGAKEVLTSRRAALLATASAQAGDGLCGWLDSELVEIQKRMSNVQMYEQSGRAYALAGMGAQLQQRAVAGATMNNADAFAAAGSFGESFSCSDSAAHYGSIGYQTLAMREMVAKSKIFAHEDSSRMDED